METITQGLMGPDDTIIDSFRDAIIGSQDPKTLAQLLHHLSPEDAAQVQSMARTALMIAQMQVRSRGYMEQSYEDLVKALFLALRPDLQALVARLLEQLEPSEVIQVGMDNQYSCKVKDFNDRGSNAQETKHNTPTITDQDIAEFSIAAGLTNSVEQPETIVATTQKAAFIDKLAVSESSGKTDAEITIADGRRFVGKLQFGKARLQDYQNATGTTFTQDEFIKDAALQDKVAKWHIADLDKAIDALGDVATDYDRNGLRAVAHLGGKSGMKKFVQSKGDYNPADELGTSLQSYYDKFAQRGDA